MTEEQLRKDYEVEKELAGRLRNSTREQRRNLYSSVYEEFYKRVPHDSQLVRKLSPEKNRELLAAQMGLLTSVLGSSLTFLEVGPGDCALSFEVAKYVKQVYAIDVSETITRNAIFPENFQLILSDGCSVPLPGNTIDIAYCNQVVEHLHPEDTVELLKDIFKVLTPGGIFICITPNSLNGPHDISKHFDEIATGLHLKEYTVTELSRLFRATGFHKVRIFLGLRGKYFRFPLFPSILSESIINLFSTRLRKTLARNIPFRPLINIRLVGIK
jgi:SAM-dependent methyltransferase